MPDERRRLERHAGGERSKDDQPLPGLQVKGNLDGKLAVSLELLLEVGRRHKTLTRTCASYYNVRQAFCA